MSDAGRRRFGAVVMLGWLGIVAIGMHLLVREGTPDFRGDLGGASEGGAPIGQRPALRGAPDDAVDTPPAVREEALLLVHVRGSDGAPAEARVHVRGLASPLTVSTRDGTATVPLVAGLPCTLEVEAEGVVVAAWSASERITLGAGEHASVTLDLQGLRARGRVLDALSGAPVEGATVLHDLEGESYLEGESSRDRRRRRARTRARTGEDGTFDLCLASETPLGHSLRVEHGAYRATEVALTHASQALEVRLIPLPRFRGVVRCEDGRPADGAVLRVSVIASVGELQRRQPDYDLAEVRDAWIAAGRRGDLEATPIRADLEATADEHGRFDVALPFLGRVRAAVSRGGSTAELIDDDWDAYERGVDIVLRESSMPGGRLRLLDADRRPLSRVLVWVQEDGEDAALTLLRAKTDEEGWISTSALTEGATTRIFVTVDPDDPTSKLPAGVRPLTWVVRQTDELIVPMP